MDQIREAIAAAVVSSSSPPIHLQTNETDGVDGKKSASDKVNTSRSVSRRTASVSSTTLTHGDRKPQDQDSVRPGPSKESNAAAACSTDVHDKSTVDVDGVEKLVPWNEVRTVDVVCREKKHRQGNHQAKKGFHHGLVWYLKLIEVVRPVFWDSDIQGKSMIGRWVTERVLKKGGKFLQECEASGACKEMAVWDVLEYAVSTLGDERPWTAVVDSSCIDELGPDPSLESSFEEFVKDFGLNVSGLEPEIWSNYFTSPHNPSEPSNKKQKVDLTSTMPPSSSRPAFDRNTLEQAQTKQTNSEPSFIFRQSYREKKLLEEELLENREILIMRQERLGRLQREYRLLQERQLYLPSEQWLSERIVRQEEIFEHQELLDIQKQRCARLRAHLEVNEQKMLESQLLLQNPKSLLEDKGLSNDGALRKILEGVRELDEQVGSQGLLDEQKMPPSMASELAKNKELKRIFIEQGLLNQQIELASEMKRRTEERNSVEQEMKYRLNMDHAMKRQIAMQLAIDESRRRMLSLHNVSDAVPQRPLGTESDSETERKVDTNEVGKPKKSDVDTIEISQTDYPDVTKSIGNKDDANSGKEHARSCTDKAIPVDDRDALEKSNNTDDDDDDDDDNDDDSIII